MEKNIFFLYFDNILCDSRISLSKLVKLTIWRPIECQQVPKISLTIQGYAGFLQIIWSPTCCSNGQKQTKKYHNWQFQN